METPAWQLTQPFVTARVAIQILNRLIELDPDTAEELFSFGVEANAQLSIDDDFFVSSKQMGIGFLGLLNSIFSRTNTGKATILACYGENGELIRFIDAREAEEDWVSGRLRV